MYKVINLGAIVPDTGEVRVQIINTDLVKTAANEIQNFWDGLSPSDDKAYLHVIAMSALEFYGPNNNGDSFYEKDLKEYHPSFVADGNIFLHHANKDPKKSSGKPIFSFYNEPMHRIELILAIDKKSPNAVEVLRRLNSGEQIYVSMGVRVAYDVCSICGNKAKTRSQYCDHLRFNMKKVLDDGRQVHAINPGPLRFFDISVVNRPADQMAWALNKMAADGAVGTQDDHIITSAELGEAAEYDSQKLAAISKLSDIIKYVDGETIDIKDTETANRYEMLRKLRNSSVPITGWPCADMQDLHTGALSPGGALRIIVLSGGMPSLQESAHISGRHFMGADFNPRLHIPMMFKALPMALNMLSSDTGIIDSSIHDILGNYNGELDGDGAKEITIRIIPKVKSRIMLVQHKTPDDGMDKKAASEMLNTFNAGVAPPRISESAIDILKNSVVDYFNPTAPGKFDTFTVRGSDGNMYTTTRAEAEKVVTQDRELVAKKIMAALLGLASLGAAAAEIKVGIRALAAPALAVASYKMFTSKAKGGAKIKTLEGYEIPAAARFERAASNLSKQASMLWPSNDLAIGIEYAATFSMS